MNPEGLTEQERQTATRVRALPSYVRSKFGIFSTFTTPHLRNEFRNANFIFIGPKTLNTTYFTKLHGGHVS